MNPKKGYEHRLLPLTKCHATPRHNILNQMVLTRARSLFFPQQAGGSMAQWLLAAAICSTHIFPVKPTSTAPVHPPSEEDGCD